MRLIDGQIVDDSEYQPHRDELPPPDYRPKFRWIWRGAATIFLFLILLEIFDAR